MKQKFELMASSKANYYTKGSPVQFVRIDLLQEASSGDVAVCFSFKNVGSEALQNLTIQFKCKNGQGDLVCDSTFCYEGVQAFPGEEFGSNEAVYLSDEPLASIDVRLQSAENMEGEEISLQEYHRVRLPAQKPLDEELRQALQASTHNDKLIYEPAVLPEGWQCACGAFHPGNDSVYCDECGTDRILLQNTIANLRRGSQGEPAVPSVDEQPTRCAPERKTFVPEQPVEEPTREVPRQGDWDRQPSPTQPVDNTDWPDMDEPEEDEDYDETADREARARLIIRWVPVITGLLCLLVIGGGVLWYQMFAR